MIGRQRTAMAQKRPARCLIHPVRRVAWLLQEGERGINGDPP